MPVRMITPIRVVGGYLTAEAQAKLQVIANVFCYVGEKCIIEARNGGTYTDQSGNLRSSIGYAVLMNGQVIQSGCVDKIKNGDEGVTEGQKYLQSRIKKANKKGVVLIVTAGMNYAEYVEAKGYVVLSSAKLKAPVLVKQILISLGFQCK